MEIKISPLKITRFGAIIVLTLIFLSTAGYISRFFLGYDSKLISGFSLGHERNFPTYYQSISLLFCAGLLMTVGIYNKRKRGKYTFHWNLLSVIFIYLAMDEMLEIHEKLVDPLRTFFHTGGYLRFAWVIPFGGLLIILLLICPRFLIALPKQTRVLFVTSGIVYVLGAMVIEMLGCPFYNLHGHGDDNFVYVMFQTLEEVFEMSGILIFVYGLLSYIRNNIRNISIEFDS